jgi:hypothetical protein
MAGVTAIPARKMAAHTTVIIALANLFMMMSPVCLLNFYPKLPERNRLVMMKKGGRAVYDGLPERTAKEPPFR